MPPGGDYNRGRMRPPTEPRYNPLHAFYRRANGAKSLFQGEKPQQIKAQIFVLDFQLGGWARMFTGQFRYNSYRPWLKS